MTSAPDFTQLAAAHGIELDKDVSMLRVGGAEVSEKHSNFLINSHRATAADIEALGELVRAHVLRTSGVALEWEIQRVGRVQ